jgi:hypothetical protein
METINKKTTNLEAYKTKMQTIFYNLDIKNNICPDCGKIKSMDFASINNGIIICAECAKEHLTLGYNISFIHSLSEKWDDYLFNYIKVGGNSRFIQFCKDYKLNKENDNKNITQKYKSKGLTYYRDILRSEVLGYDPPENINVNKAFEEEKNIPDNYPEFKKYSFVKHVDMNYLEKKFYTKKEEKNEEGIFGKIGGFFGNVKKNIGIGDWDIVKKVQEINIDEVKQKGADVFGYFFFGGNSKDKKEEKKEDNNENEIKNENNIINNSDNNNENKKNELNNFFGVNVKEYKNTIINNDDKKENNIIEDTKNKKEELKNEIIKENNEDKIEIKEEIKILSDETNNNIINNPQNEKIDEEIRNEENIQNDDKTQTKENEAKKDNNQNILEEMLKENNDDSKMNNEEKDELEKMLQ